MKDKPKMTTINIQPALALHFHTEIDGLSFTAKEDYQKELSAAYCKIADLKLFNPSITVSEAEIALYIEEGAPLNEISQHVFVGLASVIGISIESYLNGLEGHYDPLSNRLSSVNLGIQFPDRSIRANWNPSIKHELRTVILVLQQALHLILRAQDLSYFEQSEDEETSEAAINRLSDLLFDAGFWPSEEDEFHIKSKGVVNSLLAQYQSN